METQAPAPAALLHHTDWIRALARRLVRDAAAADDLTQEALMAALGGWPLEVKRRRPWLAGVVRHLALKEGRSRRIRREREVDAVLEAVRHGEHGPTSQEILEKAEAHRNLVDQVLELPEHARSLLLQRYFEGRGPKEIAAAEGTTVAAVSSALTRAHGLLSSRLEEKGGRSHWLSAVAPLVVPSGPETAAVSAKASVWATSRALPWLVAALIALVPLAALVSLLSGSEESPRTVVPPASPMALQLAPLDGPTAEAPIKRTVAAVRQPAPEAEPARTPAPPAVKKAAAVEPASAASQRVTGRCLGQDGSPVGDLQLQLVRARDGRPEYVNDSTEARRVDSVYADRNGLFVFEGVTPGLYVVGPRPQTPGETAWLTPLIVRAEEDAVSKDITIHRGLWIRGKLSLTRRALVSRLPRNFKLTAAHPGVAEQPTVVVGPGGEFDLGPLAPDRHWLTSVSDEPTLVAVRARAYTPSPDTSGRRPRITTSDAEELHGVIRDKERGDTASLAGTVHLLTREELLATAKVQPDGTFHIYGLDRSRLSLFYTSTDNTRYAHSSRVKQVKSSRSRKKQPRPAKPIWAEPAGTAWLRPGHYDGRGPLIARIEGSDAATYQEPLQPDGAARFVVPTEGATIKLLSAEGLELQQWRAQPPSAGSVLQLQPGA